MTWTPLSLVEVAARFGLEAFADVADLPNGDGIVVGRNVVIFREYNKYLFRNMCSGDPEKDRGATFGPRYCELLGQLSDERNPVRVFEIGKEMTEIVQAKYDAMKGCKSVA